MCHPESVTVAACAASDTRSDTASTPSCYAADHSTCDSRVDASHGATSHPRHNADERFPMCSDRRVAGDEDPDAAARFVAEHPRDHAADTRAAAYRSRRDAATHRELDNEPACARGRIDRTVAGGAFSSAARQQDELVRLLGFPRVAQGG